MNLRNCILFFLLLSCNLLRAQQAPGYLGKRLSVDYGFSCFPAVFNPNKGSDEDAASINSRNSLGVNFVKTRGTSIGLNVEWLKTQCEFKRPLYYNSNNYYADDNARGDVSAIFISFDTKRYLNKQIAPIGAYISYKLFYAQYKMSNANNIVLHDTYSYYQEKDKIVIPNNSTYGTFGAAIAFGHQHLFFQKLLLNYEFQLGLFPPKIIWSDYMDQTGPDYIKSIISNRLTKHYAFNFKLGLGYLIF